MISLSIRRPIFAWVLMFSLIVFGAICLNKMGISQMPDVDFPVVNISVDYPGAAPQVVEADLIDLIETRLLAIEGIKEMRSSARQGAASVTLEFNIERNVDIALQEVQSALSQLRLPPGIDPPTIRKQNPEEDPIVIISIFGDTSLKELLRWADNFLLDQIRFLPGVGEVSVGGFSERNLRIWIKPDQLKSYYLTISDVMEALKSQHIESAAGQYTEKNRELRVRWLGEASEPKDVGEIKILKRGGQVIHDSQIRIRDVAEIEDGLSDVRRIARVEGKQAVGIQIRKQRGTNEVDVAARIRAKLLELKDRFPPTFGYRVNVDFTRSTQATVNLTLEKLILAAVITILICFLFLGSLSSALNILFSIPTSIVGAFIILKFSGFTLNLFTLLALTLAISIVVDDAIMLLENIVRHYRMKKSPNQAALDGAVEILPAAIAATAAVVAVFLPVVFMTGVIGKYFFQFGVTLCAAVLLSLLEAVTITPMRAAAFLRTSPKTSKLELALEHFFERIAKSYAATLQWTLRFKWPVLIISLVLFVASLGLFKDVRSEFVPPQDQDIILIQAQTPPGTSLEATNEASLAIEEILKKTPYIEGFFVSVGSGGLSTQVNQMFIPLSLVPRSKRPLSHIQMMDQLRPQFKNMKARVSMRDISARNLTAGKPNAIAVNIRGADLEILDAQSKGLIKTLEEQKLGVDLDTDFKAGLPELIIAPNRDAMAARGVSIESVGQVLAASIGGLRQGRFTADGKRYDVRFKISEKLVQNIEDIKRIVVRNNAGNLVSVGELVQVKESKAPQAISRINRQRSITVTGNLATGQSQAVVLDKISDYLKKSLPQNYSFAFEGAAAGLAEAFGSLKSALYIGILIAYLILAIQFNSWLHPIAVLMALPFSLSGAVLALWLTGTSLNLFSFIGIIVLMGIAKKNSILLVEFTNQVRSKKPDLPVDSAILEGAPIRLRPILMTSAATVAAALPLILGKGIGFETRLPMGLTILGGTIISTILTLYVVPCAYSILTRLESKQRE